MVDSDDHANSEGVLITRTSEDTVAHALVRGEHELELDEPEWIDIGEDSAPWPSNYLLVATAGCQVEVLAQAFHKARIEDYEISVRATTEIDGSREGPDTFPEHMGWRYTAIDLELTVETTPEFEARVQRCIDVAEDACIVSRSVEAGIDFTVEKTLDVTPAAAGDD